MNLRRVTVALAIAAVAITLAGCGAKSDKSSTVATKIGASSCSSSGYGLKSRLDGSKSTIYDCDISGRTICVTYEDGIAKDQTATVKLLFANTLGTDSKPKCAT